MITIIDEWHNILIEILRCDSDKYSKPEDAIDAIYKLAFEALPEEKRPKSSNIVVSQIGLGRVLGGNKTMTEDELKKKVEKLRATLKLANEQADEIKSSAHDSNRILVTDALDAVYIPSMLWHMRTWLDAYLEE